MTNVYGIKIIARCRGCSIRGLHYSSGIDLTMGYEEGFIATMVAQGFAVVVTDISVVIVDRRRLARRAR